MNEKKREPLFHIVKREALSTKDALILRAFAILLALVLCGIITMITTGISPIEVYKSIILGAFGSTRKTWVTLQSISILLIISSKSSLNASSMI